MFDLLGVGAMFGSLLGTDATSGGYVAGGIFTSAVTFATAILLSKLDAEGVSPISFMLGFGLALSIAFGWLPLWIGLFSFVFILVGIVGLFGGK